MDIKVDHVSKAYGEQQILASVTFTTASRSCISTGFGFSINSNFPFETYV